MDKKIRVLVVDDSFLMRKIISDIIDGDPQLETIGKAKDGKEALEKIYALKPDVVTLDINLPEIDGISVLEEVMQKQPTAVLMLSAYVRQGASITMRALELGAVDFIAKPSGEISLDLNKLKEEIITKVKLAASVMVSSSRQESKEPDKKIPLSDRADYVKKLVVIGASTGGPRAVLDVMQDIPADTKAVFLIVQHMPEGFTLSFAERISWQSKIKAKEAENGDILFPGKAFIAAAGYHMVLEKRGEQVRIKLNQDPDVNYVRPAADVTMGSVAELFNGRDIIAVILTGMGKDGLEGVRKIKNKGGYVIAQNRETSVVWGMPKAVVDAALADEVLPLGEISKAIIKQIES